MLELNAISKQYKKTTILAGVSYVFDIGINLVTGPSGVGKSTLLRLCATAEKPSAGNISWDNNNVWQSVHSFRQVLGYAPQKIEFPVDLTAKEFMLHIGALKGIKRKSAEVQVSSILDQLGLGQDIDKRIQAYSGGMCRRLGLAQAFLGQPECLVIDEPTAELDPLTAKRVHSLILDTAKNAVVIMTTHLEQSLEGKYDRKLELNMPEGSSHAFGN